MSGGGGQLELTWSNKDMRLLAHGADTYEWVDPTDWRVSEVRLLEHVETVGEEASGNLLIQGDALHALTALSTLPDLAEQYRGKVKLCYIDPPFNTGQTFTHYDDAVEHSVWLTMLRDRLRQIHKLLSPDGSVWVHLDDVEIHRARCVLDEVFGAENFINQVVWKRTQGKSAAQRGMGTMCESILVYGRSETSRLRTIYLPLSDAHLAAKYRFSDARGRYSLGDLTAPGARSGDSGREWRGRLPSGRARHWAVPTVAGITDGDAGELTTQERLDLLDAADYIHWPPGDSSVPMFKRYLTDEAGTAVGNLWDDIGRVANTATERTGFDTQKPELLLQRVFEMGTEPGDIVLDCFAGSGSSAATAHKMGRRWVTVELLENNVQSFIRPRLRKVIDGDDAGGVTSVVLEQPKEDLPTGVSPEDAKAALKVLEALTTGASGQADEDDASDSRTDEDLDEDGAPDDEIVRFELPDDVRTALLKRIRAASRTKKTTEVRWKGGGGFDVVRVGPSMFEEEDGTVFLAEWATGGALAEAVCAQLGYTPEADGPFAGRKGRSRLAVIDGMLTAGIAEHLAGLLDDRETLMVVAQALEPGVEDRVRELRRGSRARKVPRDLARVGILPSRLVRLGTAPDGEDA